MKNWFARWFGGAPHDAGRGRSIRAAAPPAPGPHTHAPGDKAEVDAAFCAALLGHARRLAHGVALEWEFPAAVAGAIAGAGAGEPDATPLGQVLATADALAKLRLLVDAGELPFAHALVASVVAPHLHPVFDLLTPQEA